MRMMVKGLTGIWANMAISIGDLLFTIYDFCHLCTGRSAGNAYTTLTLRVRLFLSVTSTTVPSGISASAAASHWVPWRSTLPGSFGVIFWSTTAPSPMKSRWYSYRAPAACPLTYPVNMPLIQLRASSNDRTEAMMNSANCWLRLSGCEELHRRHHPGPECEECNYQPRHDQLDEQQHQADEEPDQLGPEPLFPRFHPIPFQSRI